jgi:UDP-N-acetylglucosamine 2-epimerase (non-hydrolysing)
VTPRHRARERRGCQRAGRDTGDRKAAMTLLHITGARPNFPKAAPVIAALASMGARQRLVHTGQHYDDRMSEVFFRELDLPRPDINLGVGSGTHAQQTAAILVGLEEEMLATRPEMVIVYGDVNSTLAAAIAASKLGFPVAHVEAGLRSFDMSMPEEINRIVTDRLSDVLLCTSPDAIAHLAHEGVEAERIHLVGNPMIDTLLANLDRFDPQRMRSRLGLPHDYIVATLHRPGNVDDPETAGELVAILHSAAARADVVLPLHPRGRAVLEALGLGDHPRVHVVEPLGYLDFMGLVRGSRAVITDSGGVQEETTMLGIPCLTLRPNTERPVTITHGTNRLATPATVLALLDDALETGATDDRRPPLWDGHAGERIARVILDDIRGRDGR